jgi:cytochrome c oxidase cbb3-type subunit 3
VLDPAPRDFTAASDLDRAAVVDALVNGRPGTAMKAFSAFLDSSEMDDVATFVLDTFVACARHNTRYHTAANGWPDHERRYADAIPFATGALALDTAQAALDLAGRRGRALFRSTCISCHDGRLSRPAPLAIRPGTDAGAAGADTAASGHDDPYDVPTIHDFAPSIPDLTVAERRGERLYTGACAQCHAADGSGQNWIGRFLNPSPPDFRSAEFATQFDAATFAASVLVAREGTSMPNFGSVFTTAMAADIAAYVRRAFIRQR